MEEKRKLKKCLNYFLGSYGIHTVSFSELLTNSFQYTSTKISTYMDTGTVLVSHPKRIPTKYCIWYCFTDMLSTLTRGSKLLKIEHHFTLALNKQNCPAVLWSFEFHLYNASNRKVFLGKDIYMDILLV